MQQLRDGQTIEASRRELEDFVLSCQAVLDQAKLQITKSPKTRPVFNHYYSPKKAGKKRGEKLGGKYAARARELYEWSRVFNRGGVRFAPASA